MNGLYANYVSCFVLNIVGSRSVPQAALKVLGSSKSLCLLSSQDNSHILTFLADYVILYKGLSLFPSLLL